MRRKTDKQQALGQLQKLYSTYGEDSSVTCTCNCARACKRARVCVVIYTTTRATGNVISSCECNVAKGCW